MYFSIKYNDDSKLEGFNDKNDKNGKNYDGDKDLLGLSYLGLEEANYPALLDTYFANNSPVSDSGVISRQKDTKFCINNSAMNYREQLGQFENCGVANDIVNKMFTLDINSITDYFTNKVVDDVKEFETKYINTVFKPNVDAAMEKYVALQNDIMIREKMLTQNEEIMSKFDKMNTKLSNDRENMETTRTDEKHLINEYTNSIASNKDYNKKLKKYIKYTSVVLALVILYFLFKMQI